jgi:hypothetical protein
MHRKHQCISTLVYSYMFRRFSCAETRPEDGASEVGEVGELTTLHIFPGMATKSGS